MFMEGWRGGVRFQGKSQARTRMAPWVMCVSHAGKAHRVLTRWVYLISRRNGVRARHTDRLSAGFEAEA